MQLAHMLPVVIPFGKAFIAREAGPHFIDLLMVFIKSEGQTRHMSKTKESECTFHIFFDISGANRGYDPPNGRNSQPPL